MVRAIAYSIGCIVLLFSAAISGILFWEIAIGRAYIPQIEGTNSIALMLFITGFLSIASFGMFFMLVQIYFNHHEN